MQSVSVMPARPLSYSLAFEFLVEQMSQRFIINAKVKELLKFFHLFDDPDRDFIKEWEDPIKKMGLSLLSTLKKRLKKLSILPDNSLVLETTGTKRGRTLIFEYVNNYIFLTDRTLDKIYKLVSQ